MSKLTKLISLMCFGASFAAMAQMALEVPQKRQVEALEKMRACFSKFYPKVDLHNVVQDIDLLVQSELSNDVLKLVPTRAIIADLASYKSCNDEVNKFYSASLELERILKSYPGLKE